MADDESAALDALEREASEFNKDAEIDRILKAFRLDPYAVLDLQPGVPASDIKLQYRKKSLLIHPDKTSNPAAPEAFDRLKKAETTLVDDGAREKLDEAIADARQLLMREHKYTVDSPELRTDAFKAQWREKTKLVLMENEVRRRKQLKGQLADEGRQQRKEDDELETRKRRREHETQWEQTRDGRINSWRDFKKGHAGKEEERKKKKKLKVIG
ncbi:MAG: hypothetical protein M1826_002199 [Phylliscum demangeonii]|nr:MAG: hypothetical protein M1826_002199 [Phylliscum demangeonii]